VSSASLSLGSPIFAIASAPFETCLLESPDRPYLWLGLSLAYMGSGARASWPEARPDASLLSGDS
jgi:hypothetical protein